VAMNVAGVLLLRFMGSLEFSAEAQAAYAVCYTELFSFITWSSVGLMGVVADAALAAGVEVIGVIPRALARREVGHTGLTELRLVDSMHERKALMAALSDAFVALPGGVGTLEETFEVLSWAQLGIHTKPIGALNVAGYWDDLIRFLSHTVREGFVRPECLDLIQFAPTPAALLDGLDAWRPPSFPRPWLSPSQA